MSNFVKEWYNRGNKELEDSAFRFVSYFIAFNYLYASTRQEIICGNGQVQDEPEWRTVERYAGQAIINFCEAFDLFGALTANSEFYRAPVKNAVTNKTKSYINHRVLLAQDVSQLFLAIYQVRCNLFHGSKSMQTVRSKGLISDGAKVLGVFLEKWIQKHGGKH